MYEWARTNTTLTSYTDALWETLEETDLSIIIEGFERIAPKCALTEFLRGKKKYTYYRACRIFIDQNYSKMGRKYNERYIKATLTRFSDIIMK